MAWTTRTDQQPSDREVKSTLVHRLRENPYTQDCRIKVTVHDGVVDLGGEVDSLAAKRIAAEEPWVVPGVFEVNDELIVSEAA